MDTNGEIIKHIVIARTLPTQSPSKIVHWNTQISQSIFCISFSNTLTSWSFPVSNGWPNCYYIYELNYACYSISYHDLVVEYFFSICKAPSSAEIYST